MFIMKEIEEKIDEIIKNLDISLYSAPIRQLMVWGFVYKDRSLIGKCYALTNLFLFEMKKPRLDYSIRFVSDETNSDYTYVLTWFIKLIEYLGYNNVKVVKGFNEHVYIKFEC